MDDMKLLSTEAEGVNEAIPEEQRSSLVNSHGRVGALLGLQDRAEERSAGTGDSTPFLLTLLPANLPLQSLYLTSMMEHAMN